MNSSHKMIWNEIGPCEHFVQFYEEESGLLDSVDAFIGAGMALGDAGIVIATRNHLNFLEDRFRARYLDLPSLRKNNKYFPLDAQETLTLFMDEKGFPDQSRFNAVIEDLLDRIPQGSRIRAFGEMVALLWANRNVAATIRLEALWNDLAKSKSFALFCGYPKQAFDGKEMSGSLVEICCQHTRVVPPDGVITGSHSGHLRSHR
jgi:hypothetical protein